MTEDKAHPAHRGSDHIEAYFTEVERFSREHKKDVERFSNLLRSMKNSQVTTADKVAYTEVQNLTDQFNNYLKKNNYILSQKERQRLTGITGSKHTSVVKRRILEDFMHKIKQNVESNASQQKAKERLKSEINVLYIYDSAFINWFRLTKYAFYIY